MLEMQMRATRRGPRPGQKEPKDIEALCARIAGAVAMAMRVPVKQVMGAARNARATRARQTAMYLANVAFQISMSDAGKVFGRDRSTVVYACHRIEDEREDPDFDRRLDVLERLLREEEAASHVG